MKVRVNVRPGLLKALRVLFHSLSFSSLLSPLHVDFFPLPGQEQHSEPFFSPNAAAARQDYISVELNPQMLISCRLKVKASKSTAAFSQALGSLNFEIESVYELTRHNCCWWDAVMVLSSLQVQFRDVTLTVSTLLQLGQNDIWVYWSVFWSEQEKITCSKLVKISLPLL